MTITVTVWWFINIILFRKVNWQWAIQIIFSDISNPDTTYAVEPKLDSEKDLSFYQLQADAAIIAKNFSCMLDVSAMRITKHT